MSAHDTDHTPLLEPWLAAVVLSCSGTLRVGWGRRIRVSGQRGEGEESTGPEAVFSRGGDPLADALGSTEGEEER